jgi:hypothetical protein
MNKSCLFFFKVDFRLLCMNSDGSLLALRSVLCTSLCTQITDLSLHREVICALHCTHHYTLHSNRCTYNKKYIYRSTIYTYVFLKAHLLSSHFPSTAFSKFLYTLLQSSDLKHDLQYIRLSCPQITPKPFINATSIFMCIFKHLICYSKKKS